ncbi:hypothetical protein B296_00046008 [Ensete ventricosum]|uniref:Uncharacterized protein n=1 Tax=Ensete ventricosum TaxID=4639 RepID=A0A426YC95_ENSVE|nr:hypothetical protein B296_00046008 [Ensete ventricosum]
MSGSCCLGSRHPRLHIPKQFPKLLLTRKPHPKTEAFGPPIFQPANLPYPFNRSTHLSLPNAANSDLLLPSSLIAASSDPCDKKLPAAIFAAICLHRSPQQSFAANYLDHSQEQIEHNSSRLSYCTAAALLRNSRVHRCPIFLLLQPHPCCNRHHLQPRSRSAVATDVAAALFFLHRRCYPWLPSSTWRLHPRSPDIAVIHCLQPENCSYTFQSVCLTGWRSLRHDIAGLIRTQIGGFRDAYGC